MNNKISNFSKNFKIFNGETQFKNAIDNINNRFETKINNIKTKYIYEENNLHLDKNSEKYINLIPKNLNYNLGNFIDNNIIINKNINCIFYLQLTYKWDTFARINKFNIVLYHNDLDYTFTTGWDTFPNRLNIYNNRITLSLSKNDKLSILLCSNNMPIKFERLFFVFEEI